MRKVFGGLVLFLIAAGLQAQTSSPVVTVVKGKAESNIILTNNQLLPLIVTVEAQSFTIDEHDVQTFSPLDTSTIALKLSETSFRLPAKSSRIVYYSAHCIGRASCHFVIYSTFAPVPVKQNGDDEGIQIRLHLPSVVYIASKAEPKKADIQASLLADGTLRVENHSLEFTRAERMDVYIGGKKHSQGGFPLFENGTREFHFNDKPERIVLVFPKYTITTGKT